MAEFRRSEKNRVRRVPKKSTYDQEAIYDMVDQALTAHVGFVADGEPYVIPTLIARQGDAILLHGAASSRLMRYAGSGASLCITVTHVDGIVLARSVFHHSMHYRSAVLFGRGELVEGDLEKTEALRLFTERLLPGRWDDARQPNTVELKATAVVRVAIDLASAKVSAGPPGDEEEDYDLPVWAGILPLRESFGEPISD